jgi:poly(hydroxyalkanoate) depolymerase family esterase
MMEIKPMVMFILGWLMVLIIGAVVGAVGSRLKPHRQAMLSNSRGVLTDITVSVLGAFLGGFLYSQLGIVGVTDFNLWSLVGALAGAIILLVLVRLSSRRRVRPLVLGEVAGANIPAENRDTPVDDDPGVRIGRARVPLLVLAGLIALLPLLDLLLWMIRIPDLSARPPAFGTVGTYQNEFGELNYLVYEPQDAGADTGLPLLVLLHGCVQDPFILETASGMRAIADANGFMIVYPQQNFLSSPHRCWNWYDKRNQQRDSGEASLIMGIVNQVQGDFNVDANRVYVAGISSGGAMTSILASCYRDVLAAGAVHSGMGYESANSVFEALIAPFNGNQVPPEIAGQDAYECSQSFERSIPVIELHGTADMVVFPVNSQDTIEQFAQTNDFADDGQDNDSVQAQPTTTDSAQVEGGYQYTMENYEYDGALLLQRYVVDGLSHMWSGGTGIDPLSDPKAPNASQIFWDFLSSHQLNG